MNDYKPYFISLLLLCLGLSPIRAQQSKIEMAHQILNMVSSDKDFASAYSMLEKDAEGVADWHQQLLDFCTAIYANDTIPEKELAFADRTLEALAASQLAPKTVVANAAYVLGNIAFNARDFGYMEKNITRMQQAAEALPRHSGLEQAIRTLQERRRLIQDFEQDFRERMQGTWVCAETSPMFAPIFYLHIMSDSVRRDEAIHCNFFQGTKIKYDKLGNKIDIAPSLGTKEVIYSATEGKMAAFFGYSKLDEGNPVLAATIAKAGEELSASLTRSIAIKNKRKPNSTGDILGRTGSELLGGLMQVLGASLSEQVNYTRLFNYHLTEIVPGIARLEMLYTLIEESSQKGISKSYAYKRAYLYKISPSDELAFSSYSPEKYDMPFAKDYTACPLGIDDMEAYLAARNADVTDSIEAHSKEILNEYPHLRYYFPKLKSASLANYYMMRRFTNLLQQRLDEVPEELLDDELRRDLQADIDYRSKFRGIFPKEVVLEEFGDLGTVRFQGSYRIVDKSENYQFYIHRFPKELAMMQWGEKNLPIYYSSDYVTKWLRKCTDPMEGTLRWQDKKGHEYRYEGQIEDKKLHGQGKMWQDGVLVHEGQFKEGKPVK